MQNNINTKTISIIIISLLITACSPRSKESYLKRYKDFISKVKIESSNYTDEDWTKNDEIFERYSKEWLTKFEEKLTWKEQLLVTKYYAQYNALRAKTEIIDFYNIFIKEDYDKLKQLVKEYYENDMKEDLVFLIEQAREIGEEAIKIIENILTELDINIEDFEK